MLARVVVSYRDTILDVAHLHSGQRFTIGDSPAASLTVSDASLPGLEVFELVRVTNEGALVHDPRSRTRALLRGDEVARVEVGETSVHVSLTRAEALKVGRRAVDWGLVASVTAGCVVAAVFALLMRLTPEIEHVDPSPDEPAYARYLLRPSLVPKLEPDKPPPQRPPEQLFECDEGEVGAGGGGRASREPAGRAGQKVRRQQARSSAPKPEVDNAGLLAVMATQRATYEGSFRVGAGDDYRNVWGGLDGSAVAETDGVGGLGLVGTGRGGGGTGEGTIGLGSTGLIGKGGGGVASGCPVCLRRAQKRHARAERPRVEGALDGSIIRRVTKAKMLQLQYCYDVALRGAPKLKGELELQYTIAPNGTVSTVLIEQSPDRALGECMAKILRRSRFPASSTSGTIVHQVITLDAK